MRNEYQEYFLSSDPKEIEQERKKRSALISLFPKTLGKEDKTIYVLLNNDNSVTDGSKGNDYNKHIVRKVRTEEESVLSCLTDSENKQLMKLLLKIKENMVEVCEKNKY